ncbi:MAG TPA: gamma-glutamyltransferase [Acetobacteraceae bacterium]|nr:gamma-glutamyltransferase [Acetobacteraceae bacterium]
MDGKRPSVSSLRGIVAAGHPQAAQAGAAILRAGGNAFDAAAATAAALNVVEPYMSGLAGMGMATCYIAAEKRVRTLDFITRVPSEFPAGRFSSREELSRGPIATGTPGNLAGWCELVRSYGRRSLAEVFAPAIALAREGFPLVEYNVSAIVDTAAEFRGRHAFYDDWARSYAAGSVTLGGVLRQPELARTFEAIAAEGPRYLYGGPLGQAVVAHVRSLGGCLTQADLESVAPVWLDPLVAAYRGLSVHTLPPPCEGFQYLLTLRILDDFQLSAMERNGVDHLDTVLRAIRLAAGTRITHNNPPPERLAALMSDGGVATHCARVRDGKPIEGPTEQFIADPAEAIQQHTTSFSIADADGNVVCITQSLGAKFGCGVVVPGHGVCLNNFLYWGEVDLRGPNALRPGGALALPMAPSIATRDGRPVLALGTPGSYGICQTQPQALIQHVDFGLGMQDAIDAPRARLWDGRRVQVESRIPAATIEALCARGHVAEAAAAWTTAVGGMHGIAIDPATDVMTGGCDPRRDGFVAAA